MVGWQRRQHKRSRDRKRTLKIEKMDGFCVLQKCSEQSMITEELFMPCWKRQSCVWAGTFTGLRDFFFFLLFTQASDRHPLCVAAEKTLQNCTMYTLLLYELLQWKYTWRGMRFCRFLFQEIRENITATASVHLGDWVTDTNCCCWLSILGLIPLSPTVVLIISSRLAMEIDSVSVYQIYVRRMTTNSHTCPSLSWAHRSTHEHTHYAHSHLSTYTRTQRHALVDRESGCSSNSSLGRQLWDAMGLYFKGQGQSGLHSPGSYTVMRPIRRLPQGGIQSLSVSPLLCLHPSLKSHQE